MKTLLNRLFGIGALTLTLAGGLKGYGQDNSENLQYFKNMRYNSSLISYKIEAPGERQAIQDALRYLEDKTVLKFYEVNAGEKLVFKNNEDPEFQGGTGGPKYSPVGQFNIINQGVANLKKSEICRAIVLHEILHAFGFKHSSDSKNIMAPRIYANYNNCNKEVNGEILNLINQLYSTPLKQKDKPDLILEVTPKRNNGYHFYVNYNIKNLGLKPSGKSVLNVYIENEFIDKIQVSEVLSGEEIIIASHEFYLKNNSGKLKFVIENNFEEIDKKNNEKIFEVAKIK